MANNAGGAVFFGELLMRLGTPRHQRFVQARELECAYTGAEANVAVSLNHFGIDTYLVSAVPPNQIGDACLSYFRQYGVDVTHVLRRGRRLGLFFLETGASQRSSMVIYDRANSAITELSAGDIDWDSAFENRKWFHFCGTAPALGGNVSSLVASGCVAAKKHGLTISCDLNYRAKLWSCEKAREVMTPLMEYIDYVIGNEEDSAQVFGIGLTGERLDGRNIDICREYGKVAATLVSEFELRGAALSVRQSHSASDNTWSGVLCDGESCHCSDTYRIHIVDRVGAGDSFAAGLIYGWMNGTESQATVDFAAAASCLKHTIHGDFNLVSVDEVKDLVRGNSSGRVKR